MQIGVQGPVKLESLNCDLLVIKAASSPSFEKSSSQRADPGSGIKQVTGAVRCLSKQPSHKLSCARWREKLTELSLPLRIGGF